MPLLVLATQADGLNGFGGQTAWLALRPTRGGDVTPDQIESLGEDHALWPWPLDFGGMAGFTADLNPPRLWNATIEASGDRRLLVR